ncbi:BACON domain-containing protein [Streptomyces litchfieldiae]|uniref:Sigma-70 family RNA polymerase sigma factor n=1 Tax=Streptomyces litchfieldiae TaxID=3075543 RepID=A0ABU2MJJ7_9ACTN|nr:sigma-70 family RNA polymerase sigma factor [Streptomyces sp. DSM 44938]MDT0341710.1 sigma-70 family RNA polymerase sigma factor [Streptomyces sp. DSM 44938]
MTRSRERSARAAASASHGSATPTGSSASARTRAAYDDAYLDGLFTYCLSVMGEHDAATAALGEALALAERQHERGRRPADPALLRSWLYALARWACLRRLAARPGRGDPPAAPRDAGDEARRRRELAALAWPEAAGTTPEGREALELAVRHQLAPPELARVLRLPLPAAQVRLTAAAREVERTRAALAAVEAAGCPAAAALSGDDRRVLLGPGLRRELLRHVEECAACRLIARRATADADWPRTGSSGPSRLPVLPAPRDAVHAARLAIRRARAQHLPRYDRAGFPVPEKDRAARRERLRGRAVTTTVAVAVVAAPVLALWAATRGMPAIGEVTSDEGPAAAAEDPAAHGMDDNGQHTRENAGPTDDAQGDPGADGPAERDGARRPAAAGQEPTGAATDAPSAPAPEATEGGGPGGTPGPGPGAGRLVVEETQADSGTWITLTATGGSAVDWTAAADGDWLSLSRTAGTLHPGETVMIQVTVDRSLEPAGPWRARVTVEPVGEVVTVEGSGAPEPEPSDPPPADPGPTPPPGTAPDPEPGGPAGS